jgi:probable HAF family extracellular repeat protein
MRSRLYWAGLFVLLSAVFPAAAEGEPPIQAFLWRPDDGVQFLGALGGEESEALAVNNGGQVVGWAHRAGSTVRRAFLWDEEHGIQDIDDLSGDSTQATAINDRGWVAGMIGGDVFLWKPETGMVEVADLPSCNLRPLALAEDGTIYGHITYVGQRGHHAFRWRPGHAVEDLGAAPYPGHVCWVRAVSKSGCFCGFLEDTNYHIDHGFVWSITGEFWAIEETADYYSILMTGINEYGLAVGHANSPEGRRAFYWDPVGGLQDIGRMHDLSTQTYGVNASAQIVGRYSDSTVPVHPAFVWDPAEGITELGPLGWIPHLGRTYTLYINDEAWVVGAALIPEPAVSGLLVLGAVALVGRRRRARRRQAVGGPARGS